MKRRKFRLIAILVLFFYSWTFTGLFNIAYAATHPQESPSPQQVKQEVKQRPEEKFQQAIEGIEKAIADASADTATKKTRLKSGKEELESLDTEIRKQFAETEQKLTEKGLPPEILRRHRDFVRHYEDNLNELRANLEAVWNAKTDAAAAAGMEKVRSHLEKVSPPKKHKPLDPNKLPHRTPEVKKREPRIKIEDFQKDGKQIAALPAPDKGIREQALAGIHTPVVVAQAGIQDALTNKKNKQPILLAANGSLRGLIGSAEPDADTPQLLQLARLTDLPTPADLAQTIEVQLTPAIMAKAQELNYNPVKIYNWVRNNVEYVPTYGSIQGANMCLQTMQGNDFDIASLLISLLRASNIHARYIYGTIELPIEKVMNWVGGFTNAQAALDFISSGGTPVTEMISGGKIVAVRMEHVWVEAYINYYPSRGAKHKSGKGDTWIPLDASFKQYTYTQGIDIKSAVPFDAQTFVNQIQSTAIIDQANSSVTGINSIYVQQQMQSYQTEVQTYINQSYPNATVGDVLGKKEIIKQEFPYLLGTLPYRRIVTGAKYSEVPDTLRHKITFSVVKDIYDSDTGTPINITKSLPEIAGKKITLSYSPATAQDEAVINSYLPQPHPDGTPIQPSELPSSLPAYLINLKPELRIDGTIVATGTIVGMGNQETFDMVFTEPGPGGSTETVSNQINSGAYYAIAIDTGKISQSQLLALKSKMEATKTKIEANDFANLTKDDLLGDILYTTALSYYAQLDAINHIQSRSMGVVCSRWPSESIFSAELKVDMLFGIPRQVNGGGLMMDVDRNIYIVKAIDGDINNRLQFMLASGQNSSALEHSVPEQMLSTQGNPVQGISAVKALKIANDQGIPVYTINPSNINTILPQLQVDDNVKADIQNAINAGREVTVSKTNITFNGWTGCGYIIIDPTTGAGAYMISSGSNGALLLIGLLLSVSLLLLAIAVLSGPIATAIVSLLMPVYLTILTLVTSASEKRRLCFAKVLLGDLGTDAVLPLVADYARPILKAVMIVFHISELIDCFTE